MSEIRRGVNCATNTPRTTTVAADNQAWFWTPEWQQGEREADDEIRAGKSRCFENAGDAVRWLDESNED